MNYLQYYLSAFYPGYWDGFESESDAINKTFQNFTNLQIDKIIEFILKIDAQYDDDKELQTYVNSVSPNFYFDGNPKECRQFLKLVVCLAKEFTSNGRSY
jgi:hypothetical protein